MFYTENKEKVEFHNLSDGKLKKLHTIKMTKNDV